MQSQDFTYKQGDNREPILATVHWSSESSYHDEDSKPIGMLTLITTTFPPLTLHSSDPPWGWLHGRQQG